MSNTQIQAIQLAEQINDEFLTCKICFEHFREPKCLSCLHTFCEECIEQHVSAQRSYKYTDYREFACPICRKKTVIPSGGVRKLNDNFLISSLNELLLSKRPSKIPFCDICKCVNNKERDATSKCVECQKLMCRQCVQTHQQMKITQNHSIYELEIEKDIMCKSHPNEQVRFFCEQCEVCVCVPCTFTEHRDHDLIDFKQGIMRHKNSIEDSLRRCRQKICDVRQRVDMLRQCETRMLYTQNEIHRVALSFIDAIKAREKCLIEELEQIYGNETNDSLKRRDELESLLDQLKSTCNLTEMVVKGKDIEMLLLKKQLCEKFDEFEEIKLDAMPKNVLKKVNFIPGSFDLGRLTDVDTGATLSSSISDFRLDEKSSSAPTIVSKPGIAAKISVKYSSDDSNEEEFNNKINNDFDDSNEYSKTHEELNNKKIAEDKATQINHRDMREILGGMIRETEVQTDIRMIHDLVPPSKFERTKTQTSTSVRAESKTTQTDLQPSSSTSSSSNPTLSTQSSVEEDPTAPVDRNKLSRRVRRHVKPGCSIAVLPSSEIIIIDPELNMMSILDRRGKFRYGMSNSKQPCTESGNATSFGSISLSNLPKIDRGIRIHTPQGNLIIKLENEVLTETPNVALAVHAYDRMAAENSH